MSLPNQLNLGMMNSDGLLFKVDLKNSTNSYNLDYVSDDGIFVGAPPGFYVQVGYPIADTITGSWTVVPLYPKINEIDYDDSNFISSSVNPVSDVSEVLLNPIVNPRTTSGHIVKYHYQKESDNGASLNLSVGLYQGNIFIAEQIHTGIQYGWASGSFTLTSGQAASITGYGDLRIRFNANRTN